MPFRTCQLRPSRMRTSGPERRAAGGGEAEIDRVAQLGAGEPQAETHALFARPALYGRSGLSED